MTKIDQLFIRACKSKDPYKRLKSIRRRFYIRLNDDDKYITMKLAEICDTYIPVKSIKIFEDLTHPFVMRNATIQEKLFRLFLNNPLHYLPSSMSAKVLGSSRECFV